ncbi:conserved hypothetical protein [Bacillus cereus H3081.97]|uniref:hypothetical protein n=1 Tax=Bacillus paranthracis TaxID=2026186 RepID=UPI00016B8D17|nr:hypothetical protein [Bacillus paranthracis]EDZ56986.1 conserved hypothetical protein [Bacillus cereus H3081.97]KLA04102.1 hypothetical protein B4086_3446 [Bacillus cereus]
MADKIISFLGEAHFILGVDLALQGKRIEDANILDSHEERTKSRNYAIGAITSAANFMEATINECLNHHMKDSTYNLKLNLTPEQRNNVLSWWNPIKDTERRSILSKYQTVLKEAGQSEFIKGTNPYQDANLLVILRNSLVHYKPEWVELEGNTEELEVIFGGKFPRNPLFSEHLSYFPNKCLGFGSSKWALESAYNLAKEFYSRLGDSDPFTKLLEEAKKQL